MLIWKLVLDGIVSAGVGTVVKNAVVATTPATIGKFGKILVAVGSVCISQIASTAASNTIINEIEKLSKTEAQKDE